MEAIRVAVAQTCWPGDRSKLMATYRDLVGHAAAQGADLVCLQEFTLSPYFASIEDDAGSWHERPRSYSTFPGSTHGEPLQDSWMTVLAGDGAYAGLVAVLQVTNTDEGGQT